MAKRRTELTEKKIALMEKEGRGQGVGPGYKPWINIQDIQSTGLVTRGMGWKTKRIHHFLSKLERDYFYVLEWNPAVTDINEQYPLIREDTFTIASDKNINHPADPKTGVPIVMTTDFLITVNHSSETTHYARTVKPSNELENSRVIEKFEIEREYWETRGVDWGIITEKELPKSMIENVEWLHNSYYEPEDIPPPAFSMYAEQMKISIKKHRHVSIIEAVTDFDKKFQLENGTGLEILKHLIARKEAPVDISRKIYTHLWIEDVFRFKTI